MRDTKSEAPETSTRYAYPNDSTCKVTLGPPERVVDIGMRNAVRQARAMLVEPQTDT